MSLFSQSNIVKYALMIGLVLLASVFSDKFKSAFGDNSNDEYELIRKYLLNDNPLYGFNRPKLWVHTTYAYNARVWKSFGSRSSYDLNQPYLHLTVKTLINHCGKDFNICLIDDESFHQLLPHWKTNMHEIPEPQRAFHRELALMELLHMYGGFLVPNSFACVKNLYTMYKNTLETNSNKPFVVEMVNPFVSRSDKMYVPNDRFLGAQKRDDAIRALCEYLKTICNQPMLGGSEQLEFTGVVSEWLAKAVEQRQFTLVDGIYVGAKTIRGKAVVLEDLMQQKELDIPADMLYGVPVPAKSLLTRTKYQWFAVLPEKDVLEVDCALSRMLLRGILDDAERRPTTSSADWIIGEDARETVISI